MEKSNKVIKNLISKMSIEQKVGSLLTLGFTGTLVTPNIYEAITKYHCGGLRCTPHARLFGSYVDPQSGKTVVKLDNTKGYKKGIQPPYVMPSEYKSILNELQNIARQRPLSLPLHYSFDQEGDTSANYNCGGVNIFPMPMGIRASGDKKMAYHIALAVARQGRAVGFTWIHSPVLDINIDPNNPEIYIRSYSDRVDDVVEYALEACKGFKEGGLIATGKHFPGRGDSAVDPHYELPVINIDKDTLMKRELLPYKMLIEKNLLPAIMPCHSIFPALDKKDVATVSKPILTGLLREKLNFKGVIATDSMTMAGIAVKYGVAHACALSLEAGADLVLMKAETSLVKETYHAIMKFVEQGRISSTELDDKVFRVLNTKYEYGLFKDDITDGKIPENIIKDKSIIDLSRVAAKKSVLIVRDRKKVLPFSLEDEMIVIEQITKTPNNIHWHPGLLYKKCLQYNKNTKYLEIAFTADEEDKRNIQDMVKQFDNIIITNYFERGKKTNNEIIKKVLRTKGKKILLITNTPYQLSLPDEADNVILTFSTGPANVDVVAGTIFGKIKPEGQWPIQFTLNK